MPDNDAETTEETAEDDVRAAFGFDPSAYKDDDETADDLLPETGEEDGEQNPESATDDSVEDEPATTDEPVGEDEEPETDEEDEPDEEPDEPVESEEEDDDEDEDEELAKLNREAPRRGDFERLEELYREQKKEARSQAQQAQGLRDQMDQQINTAQEQTFNAPVTEKEQQFAKHREEMQERNVSPAQIVKEVAEIRSGEKDGDEADFLPYLRNAITGEEYNEMVVNLDQFGDLKDEVIEVIEHVKTEAAANTAAFSQVLQAQNEIQSAVEADAARAKEILPELADEDSPERKEFEKVVSEIESEIPGFTQAPGAATFAVKQLLLKWSYENATGVQKELDDTVAKLTALQSNLSGATRVDAGSSDNSTRTTPEIETLRSELEQAFS